MVVTFRHGLQCVFLGLVTLIFSASAMGTPDPNPATIHSDRGAWPLYRQWNKAEVDHFARWIEHIYQVKSTGTPDQRLAKVEQLLTDPTLNLLEDPAFLGSPSNPQLDSGTLHVIHGVLDCGKLATALPAYYAYRRGLPWMMGQIRSGDGGDIRTSSHNVVVGSASSFDYDSPDRYFRDIVQAFCTGNYRINPDDASAGLSDTCPVGIERRFLKPGCLFYLDGHVLIVAYIDKFGAVYFIDSTTSTSRDIHTHNGLNAVTGILPQDSGSTHPLAGCYRGFRVFRFPVAETNADGKVLSVRRRSDKEMQEFGYSTEQYAKIEQLAKHQSFREAGVQLDSFHDFVRMRMRSVDKVQPFEIVEDYANRLVALFEEREALVQAGWREVQANGPIAFPEGSAVANAFNAGGRWGQWSTAATDADLRGQYFRLLDNVDSAISWLAKMPRYVEVDDLGPETQQGLALRLIHVKNRVFANSYVQYTNSLGQSVPLSLLELERRLYDLSFDPNQPPELRWGAPKGSAEARTAKDSATPLPDGTHVAMWEAYERQAYYRTLTHREPGESYLKTMFTQGFPVQARFDERVGQRWHARATPPLVPHYTAKKPAQYAWRTASKSGGA